MEIIIGVERRRCWRAEEELRMLAGLEQPGVRLVDVARRHEVNRGLSSQWRDAQRRGALVAEETTFMPVRVVPELASPALPAGPPAPFHPIARGRADPQLLATIPETKFGRPLPLNRLSETYAREGIALSVSIIADRVGACTASLAPMMARIDAHVLAAARLHGADTTGAGVAPARIAAVELARRPAWPRRRLRAAARQDRDTIDQPPRTRRARHS